MRALHTDRSGAAAIEFAMALPILILLFMGGFQISDAVSAYRKVTATTRALADLTSQVPTVNNSELTQILNASQQVMAPYSTSGAGFVISHISTNALLQTKVDWSTAKNAKALNVGDDYPLPLAMKIASTSAVVARVTFTYRPIFGGSYIGTIPMSDTIIMLPRASDSITKE